MGKFQVIWNLLSSKVTLAPKYDELAAKSMKFLRSVSLQSSNRALFQQESVLSEICNNIVVRNLQLRESDVETFEDNPMDYIHKDIEGSDGDTRRSAATELLRGLRSMFDEPVTRICLGTVTTLLQEYSLDPVNKWIQKDVAVRFSKLIYSITSDI